MTDCSVIFGMLEVQDARKEKKRSSIIRASLRVFASKGYDTTVLDEVAREAHLAKGTLYLYFKDKEDLYFQVMLTVLERLEAFVGKQIVQNQNPLEKMAAVARAQIGFFADNPSYFRLFMVAFTPEMATIHKRLLEPFFEKRRRLNEYLHTLVEEGKKKGLIRGDIHTRDVVFSFMGMVTQAVQSVCMPRVTKIAPEVQAVSPQEITEAIMKILVQGIAARKEGGSNA